MPEGYKKRLLDFCSKPENIKIKELIATGSFGFNSNTEEFILISKNGSRITFKIDELENGMVDFSPLFQTSESKIEDTIEQQETKVDPVVNEQPEEIEEILDENNAPVISNPTLNDLNNAIEEKNIEKVDSMLSTFAINPNTGLVDIDRAVKTITAGTLGEAIKCVQNNTNFSSDLSHYDLKGTSVVEQEKLEDPVNLQELCNKSFENILIYVKAAKLKGIVYEEEKQSKAKVTYTTLFNDRLNVLGLNKAQEPEKVENEVVDNNAVNYPIEKVKSRELALKPTTDIRKAGFADVFILTAIIIVYAVIIINLIMKLS